MSTTRFVVSSFDIDITYKKYAITEIEFANTVRLILNSLVNQRKIFRLLNNISIIQSSNITESIALSSNLFTYMVDNKQYMYNYRRLPETVKEKLKQFIEGDNEFAYKPWFGAIIYAEKLFPRELKGIKNYDQAYRENRKILCKR